MKTVKRGPREPVTVSVLARGTNQKLGMIMRLSKDNSPPTGMKRIKEESEICGLAGR
jgi:hypothetical protein